jgi:hypothetical protein
MNTKIKALRQSIKDEDQKRYGILGFLICALLLNGCIDFVNCDTTDRQGTYYVNYTIKSGNCGTIKSEVAYFQFDGSYHTTYPNSTECRAYYDYAVSNHECRVTNTLKCYTEDGKTAKFVFSSNQLNNQGSKLKGTMKLNLLDASGSLLCSGTYNVTWIR